MFGICYIVGVVEIGYNIYEEVVKEWYYVIGKYNLVGRLWKFFRLV